LNLLLYILLLAVLGGGIFLGYQYLRRPNWQKLHGDALLLEEKRQFVQAMVKARRGLEAAEGARQPDERQVALSAGLLARMQHELGMFKDAEANYQRCLLLAETIPDFTSGELSRNLEKMADLYRARNKPELAEPLLRRCVELSSENRQPDDRKTAKSVSKLADIYIEHGNYAMAEPFYARSLALLEKTVENNDPELLRVRTNLADSYFHQGLFQQALVLYQVSLPVLERQSSKDDPLLARHYERLGDTCLALGEEDLTEEYYGKALSGWERSAGGESVQAGKVSLKLAGRHLARQRLAEARNSALHAISVLEAHSGSARAELVAGLLVLAEIDRAQGELAVAELTLKRALAHAQALGGKGGDLCGEVYRRLADIHGEQQDFAQAVADLEKALAMFAGSKVDTRVQRIDIHRRLAVRQEAAENLDAALEHAKRAAFLAEEKWSKYHVSLAPLYFELGRLYHRLGMLEKAEASCKRTLELLRRVQPVDETAERQCVELLTRLQQEKGKTLEVR